MRPLLVSSRLAALAVLAVLAGCTSDSSSTKAGGSPWAPGKADGLFEIAEVGPLALGETTSIELAGAVPAYRVESYGGTELRIDLRGVSGADAYVVVEGPLPGDGDATAPGMGAKLTEDDDSGDDRDSHLDVTLDAPGVYRVLAGTYESLGLGEAPAGSLMLETSCVAGCTRPSMTAVELVRMLQASGQISALQSVMTSQLVTLVPDPDQRAMLASQLTGFFRDASLSSTLRFPILPLRQLGSLRSALGLIPSQPPEPTMVVDGDLMTLLGPCNATRAMPAPVHAALPNLGNGHFPNRSLTACQVAHSQKLAQILTSLASNNGSEVTYAGDVHTTPRSLIEALIANGHTVEVRNERTYANFISFTWGDRDVVWPVWLDTGLDVGGAALAVPMGHSEHAWRISGPEVNARVMFYLGIDGAAFFPQTQTRPAWTGELVSDGSMSTDSQGLSHVLDALDAASVYLQRIRTEASTVAAGLPADGYGFLGVCNDSNATIEYVTRGTITAFPLVRAASLDAEPRLDDGLDDAVRALPHDADVAPERGDALRRILLMTPHEAGSDLYPDAALKDQLAAIRDEIGAR